LAELPLIVQFFINLVHAASSTVANRDITFFPQLHGRGGSAGETHWGGHLLI
jgi:hypothetical protein